MATSEADLNKSRLQRFRQYSRLLVLVVVGLVVLATVLVVRLNTKKEKSYYTTTTWSETYAAKIFKSCTYGTTLSQRGPNEAAAKVYCGCIVDRFQQIYKSDEEFNAESKAIASRGYPDSVKYILRTCASKAHVPIRAL